MRENREGRHTLFLVSTYEVHQPWRCLWDWDRLFGVQSPYCPKRSLYFWIYRPHRLMSIWSGKSVELLLVRLQISHHPSYAGTMAEEIYLTHHQWSSISQRTVLVPTSLLLRIYSIPPAVSEPDSYISQSRMTSWVPVDPWRKPYNPHEPILESGLYQLFLQLVDHGIEYVAILDLNVRDGIWHR